jgi:putative SOS response-associated peptidase YedK
VEEAEHQNKQPFAFDLANSQMMAFAGLWDGWKDPANGQWLQSYTIITTEANELMAPVHDRMPVILHPRDFDRWLNREVSGGLGIVSSSHGNAGITFPQPTDRNQ